MEVQSILYTEEQLIPYGTIRLVLCDSTVPRQIRKPQLRGWCAVWLSVRTHLDRSEQNPLLAVQLQFVDCTYRCGHDIYLSASHWPGIPTSAFACTSVHNSSDKKAPQEIETHRHRHRYSVLVQLDTPHFELPLLSLLPCEGQKWRLHFSVFCCLFPLWLIAA